VQDRKTADAHAGRVRTVSELARRDAFPALVGIECVDIGQGRAVTRVRIDERHLNFNRTVHGGVTFTLADTAFGLACNSYGRIEAGIDAHIVYSVPVRIGEELTATAVEVARSQRLSTYRVDVTRADGTRVAVFTGTAYITGRPHE
jgi:acyl-CoA thioesterase